MKTNTTQPESLSSLKHGDCLLIYEEDKDVVLSEARLARGFSFDLLCVGCRVTLRTIADDVMSHEDLTGDALTVTGSVLIAVVGGRYLVLGDGEFSEDSPAPKLPDLNDVMERMKQTTFIKDVDELVGALRVEYPELEAASLYQDLKELAESRREAIRAQKEVSE